MDTRISVSIVTYNPGADINACLDSLRNQTIPLHEIFVIDNQSTDATVSFVRSTYPECTVIPQNTNLGFGKAHNIAIERSTGEWILVLNQDVVLEPDAIEKMLAYTNDTSIAAIGPKLYISAESKAIDTTGIRKRFYYKYEERNDAQDKKVWGISGACALYRKEALDAISYGDGEVFDEHFFMYKEDVDLSERLAKKGWQSQFVGSAIGYHNRTGSKAIKRENRPEYIKKNSYKNHLLVLIKHVSLLALPVVLLYEIGKAIYLLLTDYKVLAVLPEVFRLSPIMIKRRYVS